MSATCPTCGGPCTNAGSAPRSVTGSLWNGPLEINPSGGYRPAPVSLASYTAREFEGFVLPWNEEEDVT